MGRKAKRGGAKKGVRDAEKAKVAPADCASPDGEGGSSASAAAGLPMANLVRLMRQVIPKGVKVSARAKQLTHDCAVEFVGFVAGEASEQARAQHRRIISPEDFTRAFQTLGLDDNVEPMSTYFRRYREHHNIAAGYGGFVPRAPAVAATTAAAPVTAPGVPFFPMRRCST
ncbi:nuclear transcription factor Y subunit B-1-like [Panicum miliaceum]|uniref:Nuclear transcription factor Y subunit B-1-like n=1 Tax=Panicum miliaceum TaxID=4540 RepID=A0A3L6RTC5_PANMI|nr:nuclear transcription factor Y subunit B-1-like [Panicum miliaceum]